MHSGSYNNNAHEVNPAYQTEIDTIEYLASRSRPNDDVILCGDWNTEMERNNAQTNVFKHFMQRNMLKICWEHTQAKLTSTYCNYELNHNSCIDHFVLTPRMFDSIRKCVVDTSPLNPSHHRIITLEIEYNKLEFHNVENRKWTEGKIAWP